VNNELFIFSMVAALFGAFGWWNQQQSQRNTWGQ
jgi:hypothetical protein